MMLTRQKGMLECGQWFVVAVVLLAKSSQECTESEYLKFSHASLDILSIPAMHGTMSIAYSKLSRPVSIFVRSNVRWQ